MVSWHAAGVVVTAQPNHASPERRKPGLACGLVPPAPCKAHRLVPQYAVCLARICPPMGIH
jgi:hypothetical protein